MYTPIKFTKEQLVKGIARQKELAKQYKATFRLALAKFYENRVKELEAQLTGL
jgi:hypothetical protein